MTVPLVGRVDERRVLDEAAVAGRPGAVVLDGEPGVGKSRLVAEFLHGARAAGHTVLRGGCLELGGGALPYLPVTEMVRGLVRTRGATRVRALAEEGWPELARLVPALAADADPPARSPDAERSSALLLEAVLRLFVACADEAPTIVAVEDLHWVDQSTADVLAFVVRALVDERLLVVGTCRPDGRPVLRSLLASLSSSGRAVRRTLGPLSDAETATLVRSITGDAADAAFVRQVVERAEGNAFFARELASAGPAPDGSVPVGIRDLVQARLDVAGTDARQIAGIVAAAGRSMPHALVTAACALPDGELMNGLRACVAQSVLVADAQHYAFRHALTRDAVYAEMLPGERAAAHLALAKALVERPALGLREPAAATAELAHHWDIAGDEPRACVASAAAGAAAAAVFGYAEAERQYERAVARWSGGVPGTGPDQPDLPNLLAAAADAARWNGHTETAVARIERGLAALGPDAPGARTGDLRERHGRYLWELGRVEDSLRSYALADAAYATEPPSAGRAWALAGHATALMQTGRLHAAVRLCREALAIAGGVADARAAEGRARNTLGSALTLLGRPEEGIAEVRQAVRIAVRDGSLEDVLRGHANLGWVLEISGRLAESLDATLDGVRRSRDLGLDRTGGAMLLANAASVLAMLGRWDEAEETLEYADDRQPPPGFDRYQAVALAELDVGRGRFAAAAERLAPFDPVAGDEPQLAVSVSAVAAESALWQGHAMAALDIVERGLTAIGSGDDSAAVLRLGALGLRAAADRAGGARIDRDLAADLAVRAERLWSRIPPITPTLPAAVSSRALCAAEYRRFGEADDPAAWADVAVHWADLAQPYPAAYARLRQAEAMIAARSRPAAAAPLAEAHRTAVRLGAHPLLRVVEAVARSARLDLGRRDEPPAAEVDADPFRLTARERDVLALLAEGLTNRQIARKLFVTEKTAGVHTSNILAKMRVPNRGQAAALARRSGLLGR